ncbi:hypothetical protein NPIL_491421 [Nephila pilipes]|uniref:Uncharacterized protein n=1 Tax=Nephila pilipes TaxID=299642 RepID=A0A8X6MU39_NEPPI|nr:hypothetical protein NPIL_491421 [Nephila pilipes]
MSRCPNELEISGAFGRFPSHTNRSVPEPVHRITEIRSPVQPSVPTTRKIFHTPIRGGSLDKCLSRSSFPQDPSGERMVATPEEDVTVCMTRIRDTRAVTKTGWNSQY